jgi:Rrf2 family protein
MVGVMISKKAENAIKSILYLSTCDTNKPQKIGTISKKLNIPKEFTSKILQELTKYNIIGSSKGKAGGFYLKLPPEKITILSIIKIIEGDDFLEGCLLGFDNCSDANPCPIHQKWKICKDQLFSLLSNETIDKYFEVINDKISNEIKK